MQHNTQVQDLCIVLAQCSWFGAQVCTSHTCSRGGALSWRTSTSSDGSRSGSTSSRLRPIAIATTLTTAPRKLQMCEGLAPAAESV